MGLPSAGLSSHSRRSDFKKILATRVFSTQLLFHLSFLAQTMWPLTKPDCGQSFESCFCQKCLLVFFFFCFVLLFFTPASIFKLLWFVFFSEMIKVSCNVPSVSIVISQCAAFPRFCHKTHLHVFTPITESRTVRRRRRILWFFQQATLRDLKQKLLRFERKRKRK